MNDIVPGQQEMLDIWQRHTHAEFVLKDPDAALITMTENPYVLCIPSGAGAFGRAAVCRFYADQFLTKVPADFELSSVSQTFGTDQMVEEFVVRFTHTTAMGWMLPGLPPTNRRVEFALVAIIRFKGGRIAHEHIHWDQATVLCQLGVIDHPAASSGTGSAAQLLKLSASPVSVEPGRVETRHQRRTSASA